MTRRRLSLSKWVIGSLFGLALVNLCLVAFVTALDILVGQPPQMAVPVFAVIVTSSAIAAAYRLRARATEDASDVAFERAPRAATRPRQSASAPVYLSMTIIRRPFPTATSQPADECEGVIQ